MQVWQGSALAGVYPLVLAPALKRHKAAPRHLGLLFLAGLSGVSPCSLTASGADCFQGTVLWICRCWLGFSPMQNGLIGM